MPVDIQTHLVALKAEDMADKADELYNSRPPVTYFLVDRVNELQTDPYNYDLPVCAAVRGRGNPASASSDGST